MNYVLLTILRCEVDIFSLPLFHMPSVFMQQIFKNRNSIKKVAWQLLLFEVAGKQALSIKLALNIYVSSAILATATNLFNLQPYFMVSYDRSSKKLTRV